MGTFGSAPLPRRRRHRGSPPRRGVALIMVLTAISIFTAVVIDFSYNSRVELDLAANSRDEVRAYFLARSAVNLSRLVLHFQKQLDSTMGAMSGGGGLSSLLGGLSGAGGGGLAGLLSGAGPSGASGTTANGASAGLAGALGGAGGSLNLRLWELIPIDSGMIQMFLGGAGVSRDFDANGNIKPLDSSGRPTSGPLTPTLPTGTPPLPGGIPPTAGAIGAGATVAGSELNRSLPVKGGSGKGITKSFGDFSGSFHAEVEDETQKFNVAWLDSLARVEQMAITRAMLMFGDKRYEWLYDEDDAWGQRHTAKDIVVNLHDYIDADLVGSTIDPTSSSAPFATGFSDETEPYSRYKPTYKPKNAPLDSLDEIYMVDGVGDRFMTAFRNRLTVFPDKNQAINVNTTDPFMQLVNIYMVAANPNDPNLANPLIIQQVLRDLQVAKMFPGMGLSVQQFLAILGADKIAVDPTIAANVQGNIKISDKADTFTIHAVGEAGKVQKRLTAVVRYDSGLGKLLYWKEE